jgi:hypothetical protein
MAEEVGDPLEVAVLLGVVGSHRQWGEAEEVHNLSVMRLDQTAIAVSPLSAAQW